MNETKSNMAGVLLSGALAEVDLIGDKELRSDNEEENDAGENFGERLIQTERCGDLARAAAEEHEQEARKDHPDGVEFGEPRDHNGGKAIPKAMYCATDRDKFGSSKMACKK